MTESSLDVAAIKADHQGGLPIDGGGSIHFCSGGWVEIMDAEEFCEVYRLADALDRAQAASEGVDLLIAQAERRGAVKALLCAGRAVAEDMNLVSYESGLKVEMFLERRAGAIENGADL